MPIRPFRALRVGIALIAASMAGCASRGLDPYAPLDRIAAAAIAGEWGFQMKLADHTEAGTLRFSFDGTSLSGSYQPSEGDPRELSEIRVSGGRISWEMPSGGRTLVAVGTLDTPVMAGNLRPRRKETDGDSGAIRLGGAGRGGGRGHGGDGGGSGDAVDRGVAVRWTAYKRAVELKKGGPA